MSSPSPGGGGENEFKGFGGGEGIQRRGEEIQREGVEKGVEKREGGKEERRKKEEKRRRKEEGREISQVVGPQPQYINLPDLQLH